MVILSLPLWERGLKFILNLCFWTSARSLPLWERGLKSQNYDRRCDGDTVAPLVGAWIEIYT